MKVKYLPFLVLILCFSLYAQNWEKVVQAKLESIYDTYFFDDNNGISVGSFGSVYLTNDGGKNWEANDISFTSTLYTVTFSNENRGFIGSSSERFLRSFDGGKTWTVDTLKEATGTIKGFWFADSLTGYALVSKSTGGQVFKTTDGGDNWTMQLKAAKDLLAFDFHSADVGIATGKDIQNVYYTENGTDWNQSTVGELGGFNYTRSDIRAIEFVNETTAFATGWGNSAAGLQPSIHIKTTDGGKNWTYLTQKEENRTYVNIYDLAFKDELNGIAVGGNSTDGSIMLKTTDGGVNWIKSEITSGVGYDDVFLLNDKTWIVGGGSTIIYSEDDWSTFSHLNDIPSAYFYSMYVQGDNIITGGFYGSVLKSNDGGNNWEFSFSAVNNYCTKINNLHFLNENIGYAAKGNGHLLKTTDGANTWQELIPASESFFAKLNDVFFIDEQTGFAVGENDQDEDVIYSTFDGGASWKDTSAIFNKELNTVWFTNANNGFVAGDGMTMTYTEDAGKSWNIASVENLPAELATSSSIEDVHFYNESFGVAVGKKVVLKTTDGGKNWTYVEIPGASPSLNSIQVADENNWVTSSSSVIYRTTDGGTSWDTIEDDVIDELVYTLYLDSNNTLWAAGSNSSVYKYANYTSVDDQHTDNLPQSIQLRQNYPNPFNPSTNIEFVLPAAADITIEVVNTLGQKVKTIHKGFTQAGIHTVHYDGTNNSGNLISSGIYFYRIISSEKVITKRMIFLK